jgi:hypothetical protein
MADSLFPDLVPARKQPANILGDANLSSCGRYRFTLTRTWGAGPHVCWIGLNPSTADHRENDPTVRRWIHFSSACGFGGFVAVNIYPFRTPNPAALRRWADWLNNGPDWYVRDTIMHNFDVVVREAKQAALVVACWGAGADWNDDAYMRTEHLIEEIQSNEAPWPDLHCLGKTAGGHPIHPMARGAHRVPDDARPVIWRAHG